MFQKKGAYKSKYTIKVLFRQNMVHLLHKQSQHPTSKFTSSTGLSILNDASLRLTILLLLLFVLLLDGQWVGIFFDPFPTSPFLGISSFSFLPVQGGNPWPGAGIHN